MTLREEIYKLMLKARSWEEMEGEDSEYFTNEILSKIEKRINIKIHEIDSKISTATDYINFDKKDCYEFTNKTLHEVKEMLK